MTSKALAWARKRGLSCEQDIMAETLRQLCRLTFWNAIRTGVELSILLVLLKMVGII